MKRSGSRASKVSNDPQDSLESSLPGIPDAKWHEFLEKEEADLFILGLREEILHKCMEICFDNYLEKQAVAFTVHCAYLAWCKVLNVYYMVRDPGDCDSSKEKKSWEPDPEPEPSMVDSWGSQCVVALEPPDESTEKESDKEISASSSNPDTSCSTQSLELCSFVSDLFTAQEGEYFFSPRAYSFATISASMRKSFFSSDLCVSVDSLTKPVEVMQCGDNKEDEWKKKNRLRKK